MSSPIHDLVALMARLRHPEHGCPWDLKQTFSTIAPYTLEEASEVAEAIAREDYENLKEELGDLLFQVLFHARIAEEAGMFSFDDICQELQSKLVRRHPHVFPGGTQSSFASDDKLTPEAVKQRWQAIKAEEKAKKNIAVSTSAMPDDLPSSMPALLRAEKIQSAAAHVGFDWQEVEPVVDKIHEELNEVLEARGEGIERVSEEVGDLMFACVNLARHLKVDAEMAMRKASVKFERRFRSMEVLADNDGLSFQQLTLDEMESYWQQSKVL